MFKVILFTTLLCCFVDFAQLLKEEEILAVKDLATELVTAIAPAKVDKCKVGKVGDHVGDLIVNLHKMDKDGRIVNTIKAHAKETIKKSKMGQKIAMMFPSYNDNPTGIAMRKAAKTMVKKGIEVYVVESRKVSLFFKFILTDLNLCTFLHFFNNRNVTGQIIDLDCQESRCHSSRKIK